MEYEYNFPITVYELCIYVRVVHVHVDVPVRLALICLNIELIVYHIRNYAFKSQWRSISQNLHVSKYFQMCVMP